MHHAVVREWQAMRAAIEGPSPVPVTGAFARQIVGIVEAAHLASMEKREIEMTHA